MSEVQPAVPESNAKLADDATFIEVMIVLAKHKRIIIGLPLLVALITGALSFFMPNIYKADTKLLPPQQAQSGASAILSQLGGIAGLAAGGGMKNPADVYVGMLKSKTVANKLIDNYSLKKVYGTDSLEKAQADLAASTVISTGKDGLITIEVEGKDKTLIPKIANSYVQELIDLSKTLAVTEASQRRLFFEGQLKLSKDNLAKAEMSLKGALDVGGVISVDSESRAVVETVARLKAQVSYREVELNSMRPFVTTTHPSYRRVEEELNSLRSELSKLENGRRGTAEQSEQSNGKNNGFENIQLLRDLKYHQMLYELLAKQYEAARLDEAKDPSIIQVLDPAVEPERKSKPKRALLVLVAAMAALFIIIIWAFIFEARKKMLMVPGNASRWAELNKYLRFK